MRTKKPDIFLGITMCLLVLAAVLCIVILFIENGSGKDPKPPADTQSSGSEVQTDTKTPGDTTPSNPGTVTPELQPIDQAKLEAELKESLKGLTSEWQVVVMDPAFDTQVSASTENCKVDDWMTANKMTQIYLMATVFQQAEAGTLKLDDVLADVKAMVNNNDTFAADRLTEQLGGGDAAKGREAVKTFANDNQLKLGFNRPLTGDNSAKNYVCAKYNAELLSKLCGGKLVSEAASRQMLEILLTPAESSEIDLGITGDAKYGFIHDVEAGVCICTMGVVQQSNRSFVISIVCNEPVTTDGAKKKVKDLITLVQPYFAEQSNPQ